MIRCAFPRENGSFGESKTGSWFFTAILKRIWIHFRILLPDQRSSFRYSPSKTFSSGQRVGNEAIYGVIQITLVMPFAAKDPILEKPSEKCKSFMRSPRVFDVYREFPPFLFSNVSLFSLGTVFVPPFCTFQAGDTWQCIVRMPHFFCPCNLFLTFDRKGLGRQNSLIFVGLFVT